MSLKRLSDIRRASQEAVSLDLLVGEEGDTFLGDFVEDREAPALEDAVSENLLGNSCGRRWMRWGAGEPGAAAALRSG